MQEAGIINYRKIKMNRLFLLVFLLIQISCDSRYAHNKFLELKDMDYEKYDNVSITLRRGNFLYSENGKNEMWITISLLGNIKSVTDNRTDKEIQLAKEEKKKIQDIISSFRKLSLMHLSVENGNVFISYGDSKCFYFFVKLAPSNSLEEVKKMINRDYKPYVDNWYLEKRCSE